MTEYRITKHPILGIPARQEVDFTWNGKRMIGYDGEMISAALFANGIRIFGHHPKDNSPQGIFCANGQCSQCMVMVDGLPVKSCMIAPYFTFLTFVPLTDYHSYITILVD